MVKQAFKVAVVLATSAVALPYAMAFLSHMMWGSPRNYKRALSPRKVYMFNYSLLMQIKKLKYALLKLKWMYFYQNAKPNRLVKDLRYGTNDNQLDLYIPVDPSGQQVPAPRPVIVFLYGGSWSSGDKNMYGLLCAQLADNTQALVCCPNYSIYPKGLVDDMVQDVVDCVDWLQQNAHKFGGNKERIALVGHSAGGHLAMLATLELVQQCLIHNPQTVIMSTEEVALVSSQNLSRQASTFSQSFVFEEGHFDGSEGEEDGANDQKDRKTISSAGSDSFFMVGSARQRAESGNSADDKPASSENFVVVGAESNGSVSDREAGSTSSMEEVEIPQTDDVEGEDSKKDTPQADTQDATDAIDDQEAQGDIAKESDPDTTAEAKPGETEPSQIIPKEEKMELDLREEERAGLPAMEEAKKPPHISIEESGEPEPLSLRAQVTGSLAAIKLIVGLAGVYDITDHYEHESWRGIEDISCMARAMFGPQHFQRFSPAFIAKHLPKNTRIPAVQLIHGDKDIVVPDSSSMKMGKALWDMGCRNVQYSVIPQCDHYEICLDLMDPERTWHSVVMNEILRAVKYNL